MHLRLSIVAAALFVVGSLAHAGISSTGGAVVIVNSPPADVSSNHWESNTQIRIFAEQQNLNLPQNLAVDISVAGTSPGASDDNLSAATLSTGTAVNSYTLHYDVNGQRAANNALEETGSVTFSEKIIGLIALSDSLNNSNAELGLSGVTYSSGNDHGLDLAPGTDGTQDSVTLSADLHTVTVDLRNGPFADDLRIVTAVPEPITAVSASMIFAGFFGIRRKSRRQQ